MNEEIEDIVVWIGSQLRQQGLRQKDLATHLGLPPSRMSEIMHGRRGMTAEELRAASQFFGVAPPRMGRAGTAEAGGVPVLGVIDRAWIEADAEPAPEVPRIASGVADARFPLDNQAAFLCRISNDKRDIRAGDILITAKLAARANIKPDSLVVIERRMDNLLNWAVGVVTEGRDYKLLSSPMKGEHVAKIHSLVIATQRSRVL